jgi:hypothetical protein
MATTNTTTSSSGTVLLLLNHGAHTGSHAVCEAIGRLSCVQADATRASKTSQGRTCGELHVGVQGWADLERNVAQSTSMYYVAIVGLNPAYRAAVKGSTLWRAGRVRVLTLIRTNLMRWSLSQYCLLGGVRCVEDFGHPQFYQQATLQRNNYSIAALARVAQLLPSTWRGLATGAHDFGSQYSSFLYYVRRR